MSVFVWGYSRIPDVVSDTGGFKVTAVKLQVCWTKRRGGYFPYSFWQFLACFSFYFIVIKLLILVSGTFLTQLLVSAPQFKNVLFLWFWWSNITAVWVSLYCVVLHYKKTNADLKYSSVWFVIWQSIEYIHYCQS